MKYLILTFFSCFVLNGFAGEENLIPFVLPWDDATESAMNLSETLHKPAGKFGSVQSREGHLFVGDQRIRFFGVNLTGSACYPDHLMAEKIAARMAKFGINAVRLHFLDATWSNPTLINYKSGSWSNWNPEMLDRLDYFISQLRKNGIYINMNLLVGRKFGMNDGVDPQINALDWKTAHAVGFFHQPHLEAQKQYAKKLLTHQNPYTHLTYAEDPAVAFVEINNENGLLHTWYLGKLGELPEAFANDFQGQWNEWLKAKYASTDDLAKAWGARHDPIGSELLTNADFSKGLQGWNLEEHQGAKVNGSVEKGVAILKVRLPGKENWHVQFHQPNLKVTKEVPYTFSFRASSETPRKISVGIMQAHAPWGNVGFHKEIELTQEPRDFKYTFIATDDDSNVRLCFSQLNQSQAEFRFSGLSFKSGGRIGLGENESLEVKSVSLPKTPDSTPLTTGKKKDLVRFFWETEKRYWTEMRRFIREDLGTKALVVGTAMGNSAPGILREMDVMDLHAYWKHPRFPGKDWDQSNWYVDNESMVDHLEEATVTGLSLNRVLGKPQMVSEYNHPAPNPHAGEGPLFVSSFAGLQDWDAIFLYTYSHDDKKTKAGKIPDIFDLGQHPTIMANLPIASLLFRRGDITPTPETLKIPFSEKRELETILEKGGAWNVCPVNKLGVDPQSSILRRISLDLTAGEERASKKLVPPDPKVFASENGQVKWSNEAKAKGIFELHTPKTKLLIGHLDGKTLELGDGVKFSVGKTQTGWCTMALSLLEGETFQSPTARILVVLTGYTENTAMGWKNAEKSTVGTDWGKPPSLVESIKATLNLPAGGKKLRVYALDERGARMGPGTPAQVTSEGVRIDIQGRSLWYEISDSEKSSVGDGRRE